MSVVSTGFTFFLNLIIKKNYAINQEKEKKSYLAKVSVVEYINPKPITPKPNILLITLKRLGFRPTAFSSSSHNFENLSESKPLSCDLSVSYKSSSFIVRVKPILNKSRSHLKILINF